MDKEGKKTIALIAVATMIGSFWNGISGQTFSVQLIARIGVLILVVAAILFFAFKK